MLYGTVLDERGDQIDFSTGAPIHTHAGPAIDLGAGGCPAVYKYAYLETLAAPAYGSETTPNPLAWHVTSPFANLDASQTAYRVRTDDGTVVLDWTTTAPDPDGVYTVQLYRDGQLAVPALGDHTGDLDVDVRFQDTSGDQVVASACWENHPLAAPLDVTPLATSDVVGWTLPAASPISKLINPYSIEQGDGSAASLLAQEIVQTTAEPITVHIDLLPITGTFASTWVATDVIQQQLDVTTACPKPHCFLAAPPAPTARSTTGAFNATYQLWELLLVDEDTIAILCHNGDGKLDYTEAIDGCVIPARGAGEPPHHYKLLLAMSGLPLIADGGSGYDEYTVGSATYTGEAPVANALSGCSQISSNGADCEQSTIWSSVVALDKATVSFDPIAFALETAPDATAALEVAPNVPASSLEVGAMTWNAGDKGWGP